MRRVITRQVPLATKNLPDLMLRRLSPEAFEIAVHQALRHRLADDIPDIRIRRRARRTDSHGIRREFDLWYSFRVGPVLHHVACEVKRLTRPVSRKEMEAFFGKIVDMRERPMALMVSLAGYQSGAKKYAAAKGIGLYVLDRDTRGHAVIHENPVTRWYGRISTVRLVTSLAMVLADATYELRTAAEDGDPPWSSPPSAAWDELVANLSSRTGKRPDGEPSRRGGHAASRAPPAALPSGPPAAASSPMTPRST